MFIYMCSFVNGMILMKTQQQNLIIFIFVTVRKITNEKKDELFSKSSCFNKISK